MRGSSASPVKVTRVVALDEPHERAKGVAVNVIARAEQAAVEGSGPAADRADPGNALVVNLLRALAFVLRIVAAISHRLTAAEHPLVPSYDGEVVVNHHRRCVQPDDDGLAHKLVGHRIEIRLDLNVAVGTYTMLAPEC